MYTLLLIIYYITYITNLTKLRKIDKDIDLNKFKELLFNETDEEKLTIHQLNLGVFFIDLFLNKPTQLYLRTFASNNPEDYQGNTAVSILKFNEEYEGDFKNINHILPGSLPMICKPNL